MAQFGTGKNPPWARANELPGQGIVANLAPQQVNVGGALLSQPGVAQPTVYSLQTSNPSLQQHQYATQQIQVANVQQQLQPQQQNAVLPQPGIAIPTTLATTQVATVSYPTPRAAQQAQQPKQRVFTGTVTKLHDNFGFVDEDVFFQTSCVKGAQPKVGDRVLVEATYNANMPFKWNATRIQVLPNQRNSFNLTQGAQNQPCVEPRFGMPDRMNVSMSDQYRASEFTNQQNIDRFGMVDRMQSGPPNWQQQQPQQQQPHKGPSQNLSGFGPPGGGLLKPPGMNPSMPPSSMSQPPPPLMAQPAQPAGGNHPPRPGMQISRRPDLPTYRERNNENRERGRSDRDRHRDDRRDRRSPRKRSRSPRRSRSPTSRTRSPPRRRPARIALPRYMVQIPKLSLDTKESNVIMLRSRYSNLYVPSDFFNATYSWTDAFPVHRPFQLGHPCNFHIMNKEVQATESNEAMLEPSDADHLYSAKVMLLSCCPMEEMFHKSCALAEDAGETRENFQHSTRLVQFLVGLKGKSEPMAIGGPWSPSLDGPNPAEDPGVLIKTAIRTTQALTGINLSNCTQWYRFAEIRYHRPEEMHKGRMVPARVETVVIFLPDVWSCNPTRLEWESLQAAYKKQLMDKLAEESKEEQQEEEEDGDGSSEKKDPTHHSELDPRTMKVADLRRELECRNLSSKGLKSQLIARLTKATKSELEKEEQEAEQEKEEEEQKPEEEEKPEVDEKEEERKRKEEEEKKRREERDKAARERRYTLPENPSILVHPSATAKSGKFDCTVMSLSLLLDYRPEDNKEHSFEVSLFAELFNEMMMRDFAFRIYKALVFAPEKKEEKKEKDKEKDLKEKDPKEKDSKDKDSKDKDKDKESDDKEKEKAKKDDKEKEKKSDKEEKDDKDRKDKESKEKDKEDEKESRDEKSKDKDEPSSKRRKMDSKEREEDNDDDDEEDGDDSSDRSKDRRRTESGKKRDKEKMKLRTVDPDLLLSFVYFDQTHTGYLLDKDVEELIHTIGLHLSRAQVKKLVQKVVHRETLYYRKLTDKEESKDKDKEKKEEKEKEKEKEKEREKEKEKEEENKEEREKEEEMEVDWTEKEKKEEKADDKAPSDEELARGNRQLIQKRTAELATTPDSKASKPKTRKSKCDGEADPAMGFVMYNGGVVDIQSIMQRLEKSEKTRTATEAKLKDTQEDLEELRASFSSSEQNSQKVALELQDLKKKLRDQKKATESAESAAKRYQETLIKSKSALASMTLDVDKALSAVATTSSSSSPKSETKVKTEPSSPSVKIKSESKDVVNGKS